VLLTMGLATTPAPIDADAAAALALAVAVRQHTTREVIHSPAAMVPQAPQVFLGLSYTPLPANCGPRG
jgi:hypothetical protein